MGKLTRLDLIQKRMTSRYLENLIKYDEEEATFKRFYCWVMAYIETQLMSKKTDMPFEADLIINMSLVSFKVDGKYMDDVYVHHYTHDLNKLVESFCRTFSNTFDAQGHVVEFRADDKGEYAGFHRLVHLSVNMK